MLSEFRDFNPLSLTLDFEQAYILPQLLPFRESRPVVACFLNICQNVHRCRITTKLGSKLIATLAPRSNALALLPIANVVKGFEELMVDDDIPVDVVTYFETNYFGQLGGSRERKKRLAALFFYICGMHVRECVLEDGPRTNNGSEVSNGFRDAPNKNTH